MGLHIIRRSGRNGWEMRFGQLGSTRCCGCGIESGLYNLPQNVSACSCQDLDMYMRAPRTISVDSLSVGGGWLWAAPRRRGAGTPCEFAPRIRRAMHTKREIVCTCQLLMHAACQKRWLWAAPRRRGAAGVPRRRGAGTPCKFAWRIRRANSPNSPCELWHTVRNYTVAL